MGRIRRNFGDLENGARNFVIFMEIFLGDLIKEEDLLKFFGLR